MSTGVDLFRPDPVPQPLLNGHPLADAETIKGVEVQRAPGLRVRRVYAGGSGWAPVKRVGEVNWDSAEYNVVLAGAQGEETFRYGADVAAGPAAAMFAIFLSAMEHDWPVDIAFYRPEGKAPIVMGAALSAP